MREHFTRRRAIGVLILLLIMLWWLWPDGRVARVQALQQELFSEAGKALSQEQRQQLRQQLRAETEKLSAQQKAQLSAAREQRMQQQVARYFTMSPAEKQHYLDEQINRELAMQQQMQKAGGNAGGPPPGFGGGGGPGGKAATPEERERRRQQRLDATSPEFRGQMDIFRRDLAQRRQQRGLPASTRGAR